MLCPPPESWAEVACCVHASEETVCVHSEPLWDLKEATKEVRAACCRAAAAGVRECAEGHCIRHHAQEGTHLTHFFSSMVLRTHNTPRFP